MNTALQILITTTLHQAPFAPETIMDSLRTTSDKYTNYIPLKPSQENLYMDYFVNSLEPSAIAKSKGCSVNNVKSVVTALHKNHYMETPASILTESKFNINYTTNTITVENPDAKLFSKMNEHQFYITFANDSFEKLLYVERANIVFQDKEFIIPFKLVTTFYSNINYKTIGQYSKTNPTYAIECMKYKHIMLLLDNTH